jgi:replication fork protection complex subunit Csm3/Swi3
MRCAAVFNDSIYLLTAGQYGDIARMLNMYQLWLDDLYPRAKFADALAIIEKVGHTKRMQMMRKEWIDAGKPRRTTERDDEDGDEVVLDHAPAEHTTEMEGLQQDGDARQQEPHGEGESQVQAKEQTTSGPADADPDEDELDALLAESAQLDNSVTKTLAARTAATEEDPFADEMEAMADMEDMW